MRFAAAVALALTSISGETQAAADPARYMPTELIAETSGPRPGSTVLIGFRMTPRPGWHGYWSNPGDSGITPTVEWIAPPGVSFAPLVHPAPRLLVGGGIASFVHDGPHILLSQMSVARSVAPGTPLPVKAKLSWAACTESQCVPLHATFALDLVAGSGASGNASGILRTALRRVPQPGPRGTYWSDRNSVHLAIPEALRLKPSAVRFFPDQNDTFATARAQAGVDNGKLTITAPAASVSPKRLAGVVSDGRQSHRIVFDLVEGPTAEAVKAEVAGEVQPRFDEAARNPARHATSVPIQQLAQADEDRKRLARSRELMIAAALAIALIGAALALRFR